MIDEGYVSRIKPPGDFMFMLCSEFFCRVLKAKEVLKNEDDN